MRAVVGLWERFDRLRRHRVELLSGGRKQLLDHAEWEVESVLHLGRGVVWLATMLLVLVGGGASAGTMIAAAATLVFAGLTGVDLGWHVAPGSLADRAFGAAALVGGCALWLIYWRVLRRSGAWRWLRYPVILVDVVSVARFALGVRGAALAGVDAGLTAQQLGGTIPAALMLVLLCGVLRLTPFTVLVSGFGTITAQVVTGWLLEVDAATVVAQVALLSLTFVLGMQFVFVLRGMALKAAQEDVLERFVPQGLTRRLAHAGGMVPPRIVPVTIIIADIRGFTAIAEPLGPREAVGLLNDFFATMVGPLAVEGAVLDKYLGDGMLAFVEGEDHAARGLRAARAIVAAVEEGNTGRATPLRMGIAVHSAPAFVGSIGAPTRMEYTVIGDAVNTTARLEGLMSTKAGAERIETSMLVSGETVRAAAAAGLRLEELRGPRSVTVHGRAQPLDVYYLPRAGATMGAGEGGSAAASGGRSGL